MLQTLWVKIQVRICLSS